MHPRLALSLLASMFMLLVASVDANAKSVDPSKPIMVKSFTASVKGAAGLPEAVRGAVIQTLKDDGTFKSVLKEEEAKGAPADYVLEGTLVNFEAGNAAKRLMVGFGSGRSHAVFEFVVKEASTGQVVWQKSIKQTASFWFNGTTSSAAERAELPDGVAKKLVEELKKSK
jgi:ABC-type uncharacterized transport system auxiliary subunit